MSTKWAGRVLAYGLLGLTAELAWTGLRGRPRTSPWMFPVYAVAQLGAEPLHDAIRRRPAVSRACAYAAAFTAAEYGSGRALRALRGDAPWNYGHTRWNFDGLIRAGYVPLWGAAGLLYERVHDTLTP